VSFLNHCNYSYLNNIQNEHYKPNGLKCYARHVANASNEHAANVTIEYVVKSHAWINVNDEHDAQFSSSDGLAANDELI